MELRTYTGLWNVEKRLYRFYDINLPYPVTLRQIGVLFGFGVPWVFLLAKAGLPFQPPLPYLLYLAPPLLLAWQSNRPVAEGKTLVDYAMSQIMFAISPRTHAALTPIPDRAHRHRVHCSTWRHDNATPGQPTA